MTARSRSNPPKLDFQFQTKPTSVRELQDPHIPCLDFARQSGRNFVIKKTTDVDFYPQKVPLFLSQYRHMPVHTIPNSTRSCGSVFSRRSESAELSDLDTSRSFSLLFDKKYRIPDMSRNSCSDRSRTAVEYPNRKAVNYMYDTRSPYEQAAGNVDPVVRKRYKFEGQTSREQASTTCKAAWRWQQCGPDKFYDMTDKKHERLFILPSLHNMRIFLFLVLPDSRLLTGSLQIGGNCLIFNPSPQVASQRYLQSKYKTNGLIKVLIDNIEKIAVASRFANQELPSKNQILRALSTTIPSLSQNQVNQLAIPSYSLHGDTQKHRYLDFGLVSSVIINDSAQVTHKLKEITDRKNTTAKRYLAFRTYRGDHFVFFCPQEEQLRLFVNELYQFVMKHNHDRQFELLDQTSGSEDFDFIQLEPLEDIKKTIQRVMHENKNQDKLFTRRGIFYMRKMNDLPPGKLTGQAQIAFLQRRKKRQRNKKKFQDSVCQFKKSRAEYVDYYDKYGNLFSDTIVQQGWTKVLQQKQLPDVEYSTSDMIITMDCDLGSEALQDRVTRPMVYQSLSDESVLERLDDIIITALTQTDQQMSQSIAQVEAQPQKSHFFIGRTSQIFTEDELKAIISFLPEKYSCFKYLVQFQGQTDGMRLFNMWTSYDLDRASKQSFSSMISGSGDQVMGMNDIDTSQYNIGVDYSKLLLAQGQLICVKTRHGCKVLVFSTESPPKGQGWFSGRETFILVKGLEELVFRQYKTTGANELYIKKENDRLIIGAGSMGSAITLQQDFETVQTQPCETFGSPPLFPGRHYAHYVDGEVENVEVLRFVVGN